MEDNCTPSFGARIKAAREQQGMSKAALEQNTGVSLDEAKMSEEKTLGQIAYEAAADYNGDVRPWDEANQGAWEVAAEAVVAAGRPALSPEFAALIRQAQGHMLRTPEADAVSVKLTQHLMNAGA